MGKESDYRQIPSGERIYPEIFSHKNIQKVQLMKSVNLLFDRVFEGQTINPAHRIEEYDDDRSLKKIVEDPRLPLLSKDVVAVRTYNRLEIEVKLGQNNIFVETNRFNPSPLVFLGGQEIIYEEVKKRFKSEALALLNMTERGDIPNWQGFKDSDPLIIARDNQIYGLRPGDLIVPEPKIIAKWLQERQ